MPRLLHGVTTLGRMLAAQTHELSAQVPIAARWVLAVATAVLLPLSGGLPGPAQAQPALTRVVVTIENLAPRQGTFQTPFWVGFHNGGFDLYDRNAPLSLFFPNNPDALERLVEDGTTSEISQEFLAQGFGTVDATLAGPTGPIAPGEIVQEVFLLDPTAPASRYFSYASMVIPSNDAFVANGNPLAHLIFDEAGNFVAQPFFITGTQVLDGGTEANDEVPANTAFFGQAAPDTGVPTPDGVVTEHPGFLPRGSGGILEDPRFAMADFTLDGYPVVKVSFQAAPAITEPLVFSALLTGNNEVPSVQTPAIGIGLYRVVENGTRLRFRHRFVLLESVVAAHLHLGAVGENGPVVANLMAPAAPGGGRFRRLRGELTAQSLVGPLLGQPLEALVAAIQAGNVYVNVHTNDGIEPPNSGPGDFPDGELRSQLTLVNDAVADTTAAAQ